MEYYIFYGPFAVTSGVVERMVWGSEHVDFVL